MVQRFGNGGLVPPFLTLAPDASGQLHTPAALPQSKNLQYSMDRMLGECKGQSEYYGERKHFLTLLGIPRWLSST
jgi:hypothetical protein